MDPISFVRSPRSGWKQLPQVEHRRQVISLFEELDGTLEPPISRDLPTTSKWKVFLILMRHLNTYLRQQYIQVEDPCTLWEQLEARFHHEKTIFLPHARNDWIYLRVLDFPKFLMFNAKLHRIIAQFRLCGEDVTEKELIDKT